MWYRHNIIRFDPVTFHSATFSGDLLTLSSQYYWAFSAN